MVLNGQLLFHLPRSQRTHVCYAIIFLPVHGTESGHSLRMQALDLNWSHEQPVFSNFFDSWMLIFYLLRLKHWDESAVLLTVG
jgi:hypothetical protein